MRRTLFLCVASALVTLALGGAASATASTILILDASGNVTARENPLIPSGPSSQLPEYPGRVLSVASVATIPAQTASSATLDTAVARLATIGAISATARAEYSAAISSARSRAAVSYTHLTLPTIYSV